MWHGVTESRVREFLVKDLTITQSIIETTTTTNKEKKKKPLNKLTNIIKCCKIPFEFCACEFLWIQ